MSESDSQRHLIHSLPKLQSHRSMIKDRNFKNSRLYDNHFDDSVHQYPWMATGVFKVEDFKKVQYSDSGLGQITIKTQKMRNFRELSEVNDQIKQIQEKDNGWRQFIEYQETRDGEVIITVEYCTNCTQHQGSTRHTEEQYYQTAQTLKELILKNFPSVKVYLKPLLFEREFTADSLYLQRRIGAFEVQIINKFRGDKPQQSILFSKLQQKSWPNLIQIVNKIPEFLQKINFLIQLTFDDYREVVKQKPIVTSNEINDSTLKNIQVTLTPIRLEPSQTRIMPLKLRTQSQDSTRRDQQNKLNSSDLIISKRSQVIVKEQIQTRNSRSSSQLKDLNKTSYLVRPNTSSSQKRISMSSQKISMSSQKNKTNVSQTQIDQTVVVDVQFIEQSDGSGKLLFKNIPLDNYNLSIDESYNHQAIQQKINLFEISDGDGAVQYVQMKKPGRCFLKVHVTELQTDQNFEVPVVDADVQILPCRVNKYAKSAKLKESTPNSGVYEILIEPDSYQIFIKKFGYATQKVIYQAHAGETSLQIVMLILNDLDREESMQNLISQQILTASQAIMSDSVGKRSRYLKPPSTSNMQLLSLLELASVKIVDMFTKKAIQSVQVKIFEDTTNKVFSYQTNEDGKFKMYSSSLSLGHLCIEHDDYYVKDQIYGTNKELDLKNSRNLQIPLIKKPSTEDIEFILTSPQQANFYVKLPDARVMNHLQFGEQRTHTKDSMVHYRLSKSDFQQKGTYTMFTILKNINDIQMRILLTDEIQQVPPPETDKVIFPYYWIFATIYIDSDRNYKVCQQDNLCSNFEFQSLPTIQKELPVNKQVSSFWTNNQNDDYEFQVIIDKLKSVLHNTVIGYIDGQIILKGQKMQLPQRHKVVGVFDIGADYKIFISENLVANIAGQEKKLHIGELQYLQTQYYQAKVKKNDQFFLEQEQIKRREQPSPFNDVNQTVNYCCVIDDLIFLSLYKRKEVVVFSWPKLEDVGFFNPFINCGILYLHDAKQKCMIAIGSRNHDEPNISLWKINQDLDEPVLLCQKQNSTQANVSCSKIWNEGNAIILGQVDGCIAIYGSHTLELLQCFTHTRDIIRSIYCLENTLLFMDEMSIIGIFRENGQNNQNYKLTFQKVEQIDSPHEMLLSNNDAICVQNNDLYGITKQGFLASWQNYIKRPPQMNSYLIDNDLIEDMRPSRDESYIIILTNATENQFTPHNMDAIGNNPEGISFEYNKKSKNSDTSTMIIKCFDVDQHLTRIGLQFHNIDRTHPPTFQIYFVNEKAQQILPVPDFQKKIQGLWIIGVISDDGKSHHFQSINSINESQFSMLPTLSHQFQNASSSYNSMGCISGENRVIISTENGLLEANILNFQSHKLIPDTMTQVTTISQVDKNHIVVGNQDGSCQVLKMGEQDCWYVFKKLHFNDRPITDCVLVSGSIVIASEDRKLQLINLQTGILEFTESVDKTYVLTLHKFQSDCFAGGFPDGRIKIWRREHNGQKISTRIVRTIATQKVKCTQLAPFEKNLLAVGSQDKSLEIYNIDTGVLVRSYINGHQAAVESIAFRGKVMITSGSDNRIILWHFSQAFPQKFFQCTEIQKRLLIPADESSFITLLSSGKVILWNEIASAVRTISEMTDTTPSPVKKD